MLQTQIPSLSKHLWSAQYVPGSPGNTRVNTTGLALSVPEPTVISVGGSIGILGQRVPHCVWVSPVHCGHPWS